MSMHQILGDVAAAIAAVLQRELPQLGQDWWQSNVVDRLSIQQQRLVNERRVDSLSGLDLAGLLRVFDQNWNPLGYRLNLDRQARNWLKEAQGIRNRWAHLPPGGLRSEDAYRDIDTLYRLLGVLGADQATLDRAHAERGRVLEELAPRPKDKEVALQTGQPQGPATCSKGAIASRMNSSGPARAWIWSSAQTPNFAPWLKSTEARTRRSSLSMTSWRRGTR